MRATNSYDFPGTGFNQHLESGARFARSQVGTPNAQVHKGHDEIHVFEWKYSYGNEVNRFTNVISSCGLIM